MFQQIRMIYRKLIIIFFVFCFTIPKKGLAQEPIVIIDTLHKKDSVAITPVKDSAVKKIYSPKKAAIRSAILPGLGQIYNKKYWKLPIIYGALGTSGAVFFYNLSNYKDLRLAYRVRYNIRVNNDSTDFEKIEPNLLPLSEESLRFNRDEFRRNIDYSVLIFALLWGLNVVDAAVDAHLKGFDVSPELSLRIKPGYSEMAGTNGISFVLTIR
jgi:uncharacterized protein DUF5683